MATSKTTTDHGQIQQYVEQRGGKPARVNGTQNADGSGLLRIDFPTGADDDKLEPISWEDFFRTFDDRKLAMVYQEETKEGQPSRFVKLVSREEH